MSSASLYELFGDVIYYCEPDGRLTERMSESGKHLLRSRFSESSGLLDTHIADVIAENPAEVEQLKFLLSTWVQDFELFGMQITELPTRTKLGEQSYTLDFQPDNAGGTLAGYAVRLKLETSSTPQNSEREQIVESLLKDIEVSKAFLKETNELIENLGEISDKSSLAKTLHTVKGNSGCYNIQSLVKTVHTVEDKLQGSSPEGIRDELIDIQKQWKETTEIFQGLMENNDMILMTRQEYDDLVMHLMANTDWSEILVSVLRLPMDPVAIRFKRLASQLTRIAENSAKKLKVETQSESLRVPDGLKGFWVSLIHILRNIVDHGLEEPSERESLGKSPDGLVKFSAEETENDLVVRISDDGRGINWEKIAEKARGAGLPSETQDDLVEALFSEGVSTGDQVTTSSGRGVGTSAVKEELDKLGGRIEVESNKGKGTLFCFFIPLATLANLQLAS